MSQSAALDRESAPMIASMPVSREQESFGKEQAVIGDAQGRAWEDFILKDYKAGMAYSLA
jgi:hypothetical protein